MGINMLSELKTTSERPRYFPRQVITADDLTLGQDYFRDKLRRHNRMLHGWGVICGIGVEPVKDRPWVVRVNPGYIIGPYGDEIDIQHAVCCDLRIKCASGLVEASPNPCADTVSQLPPSGGGTFFVVVRYRQDLARPVRVSPSGCGCGENPCEHSRWRDGYDVCVLDTLPLSHQPGAPAPALNPGEAPACPPPPVDPWVLLAGVTVDKDGLVDPTIDFSQRHVLAV